MISETEAYQAGVERARVEIAKAPSPSRYVSLPTVTDGNVSLCTNCGAREDLDECDGIPRPQPPQPTCEICGRAGGGVHLVLEHPEASDGQG